MLIDHPDLALDVVLPYTGKDIARNLSVFS